MPTGSAPHTSSSPNFNPSLGTRSGIRSLLIKTTFTIAWVALLISPSVSLFNIWLPTYDERRIILILILCLSTLSLAAARSVSIIVNPLPSPFLMFICLGLASVLTVAQIPEYAALELALFTTTVSACLLLGNKRLSERQLRGVVLPTFIGSTVFYGIVTLMVWAAGWAVEGDQPPWPEPLHNFVNHRFLNDWQTWLLPFLPAVLFAKIPRCRDAFHRSLSITYFAFLWALLLYSLGRATLYAQLGCLLLIPLLFGRQGLRWSTIQLGASLLGLLLLILLLGMNPFAEGSRAERLVSLNSSGRTELWVISLQLIAEHPLLGIGPMQFAALPNVTFAHPHNLVLQVAVEWGIPAALLLFGALLWAALHWLAFARRRVASPDCPRWEAFLLMSLTASMTAASANSLLAGTAHTPMSQLMLLLVVGCAYALYRQHHPPEPHKWRLIPRLWIAATLAAAAWLGGFTTYELVHYIGNDLRGTDYVDGGWVPRFWRVGKLKTVPELPNRAQ